MKKVFLLLLALLIPLATAVPYDYYSDGVCWDVFGYNSLCILNGTVEVNSSLNVIWGINATSLCDTDDGLCLDNVTVNYPTSTNLADNISSLNESVKLWVYNDSFYLTTEVDTHISSNVSGKPDNSSDANFSNTYTVELNVSDNTTTEGLIVNEIYAKSDDNISIFANLKSIFNLTFDTGFFTSLGTALNPIANIFFTDASGDNLNLTNNFIALGNAYVGASTCPSITPDGDDACINGNLEIGDTIYFDELNWKTDQEVIDFNMYSGTVNSNKMIENIIIPRWSSAGSQLNYNFIGFEQNELFAIHRNPAWTLTGLSEADADKVFNHNLGDIYSIASGTEVFTLLTTTDPLPHRERNEYFFLILFGGTLSTTPSHIKVEWHDGTAWTVVYDDDVDQRSSFWIEFITPSRKYVYGLRWSITKGVSNTFLDALALLRYPTPILEFLPRDGGTMLGDVEFVGTYNLTLGNYTMKVSGDDLVFFNATGGNKLMRLNRSGGLAIRGTLQENWDGT